jgi:hypothetical protein
MNSGVWDLTRYEALSVIMICRRANFHLFSRYGPNSIPDYKNNLPLGLQTIIKILPSNSLFIWLTTLPLSKDIKGGFVIPEIELGKSKLREDVLEANTYAARVCLLL